jgi:hypothetical protein
MTTLEQALTRVTDLASVLERHPRRALLGGLITEARLFVVTVATSHNRHDIAEALIDAERVLEGLQRVAEALGGSQRAQA